MECLALSLEMATPRRTGWTKIPEFEMREQLLFYLLDGSLGFGDQGAVINKDRKDHPDRTIVQDVHRRVTHSSGS